MKHFYGIALAAAMLPGAAIAQETIQLPHRRGAGR
jgi:hypothetical protein